VSLREAVEQIEAPPLPGPARPARRDLFVLVLFTAALGAPFLDPRVVPMHDTFYCFSNFHAFYGHFFFTGELLQWLPYGAYGLPSALQQVISFSPLDYVAALAGRILRVGDAMLLFKLARLGEQMLFAAGTWILARALFARRATALALGIAAAGTVVWYAQIWFEVRFFYLLPLVLFCVVRFEQSRRGEWLWLALLACVAWSLGNVPYFVPLWALTLMVIVAPLAWGWGRDLPRALVPTRRSAPLAAASVIAAAASLYLTLHSLDFVVIREPGRDPLEFDVDLETFLTWGGRARPDVVAQSLLLGAPVHLPWSMGRDNSAYIGLLPLAGLALALLRERSRVFAGLVAMIVLLVGLSLGGIFAMVLFYVPLLSQFRHISLVYGMVKTLLILASGFGVERLWRTPKLARRSAALLAGGLALASLWVVPAAWGHAWLVRTWLYAALGAAGLALGRGSGLRAGFLLALAVDVALYQADVRALVPVVRPESAAAVQATRVNPLPWQAERSSRPEIDAVDPVHALRALELAMQARVTTLYWNIWGFAQFDPCGSRLWTDTTTWGVDTLLRLRDEEDVDIRDALGCKVPKLRLAEGPAIAHTLQEALGWFVQPAGEAGPGDVIRIPPRQQLPPAAVAGGGRGGAIRVTGFDANQLVAGVEAAPPGSWLVYADAFHPGWTAFVDEQETFIAEANLAFKAVWVPAGSHVVRFRFGRGSGLYASYAVAVFALLAGLVMPAGIALAARSTPHGLRPASLHCPPRREPGP
jgi:hypothetical protein